MARTPTKQRSKALSLGGSLTFFVILGGILATAIVVGATTSSSGMKKRQTDDTGNTINNNNDVSSSISLQEPTFLIAVLQTKHASLMVMSC
jgi:hypothetical protein